MKTQTKILALSAIIAIATSFSASAAVVGVNLGTGLPPSALGGYTMSTFDPGSIGGQTYYEHMVNGVGEGAVHAGEGNWSTWGQSYTGNVYVSLGSSPTLTLTLSTGTEAVYFYEEPNQFANFTMTALDSSGTSVVTTINGNAGSAGVGFYESVAGGPYLSSIVVSCSDTTGFAIGEFGVNGGQVSGTVGTVPDTGSTLILLALGLSGVLACSRFSTVLRPALSA